MTALLLKVLLTPLLIAGATGVARRWGASVGGIVAALPIVSGSVSFFVAVEQGPEFAARTAAAALVGLAGVGWFCLAYARATRHLGWPGSLALAYVAFGIASLAIVPFGGLPGLAVLGFVVLTLAIVLRLTPEPAAATPSRPPWWDVPARMATATILVVAVTALAASLGPGWSGLLIAFPVLFAVLLVFTHRHEGRSRAIGIVRGFLAGLVATSLFLVIVADGVVPLGIGPAFALAAAACLGYQAAAMRFVHVRARRATPAVELVAADAPFA